MVEPGVVEVVVAQQAVDGMEHNRLHPPLDTESPVAVHPGGDARLRAGAEEARSSLCVAA